MSDSIERAIRSAIEFENRVRDVYRDAAEKAKDPTGRRVMGVLADEEQRHLDYLEHKLKEWLESGDLKPGVLETAIPSREAIERGVARLGERMGARGGHDFEDLELLRKALKVELETGEFYERLVRELPEKGKRLFARFVEIEKGHKAIVQAEIDSLSGSGFWFGMREFDLEW